MSSFYRPLSQKAAQVPSSAFAQEQKPLTMNAECDLNEAVLYKLLEEFGLQRLSPKAAVFLSQLVSKHLSHLGV